MTKIDGKVNKIERIDKDTLSIEVIFRDGYMMFKTKINEFSIDDKIEITIEKTK